MSWSLGLHCGFDCLGWVFFSSARRNRNYGEDKNGRDADNQIVDDNGGNDCEKIMSDDNGGDNDNNDNTGIK